MRAVPAPRPTPTMRVPDNADWPVLILAPVGRDAELAKNTLAAAGVASVLCDDLAQLAERIGEKTGAALIAKEALLEPALQQLVARVRAQPPWSDLPLL